MQEQRGAARHSVYLGAQFRSRGRSAALVTILDLSMLGCRIEQSYSLQKVARGERGSGLIRSRWPVRLNWPVNPVSRRLNRIGYRRVLLRPIPELCLTQAADRSQQLTTQPLCCSATSEDVCLCSVY
jgi:hypothetical protein